MASTFSFPKLTGKQARLIELLTNGSSIVAAARELKIDESTARRWLKRPDVAAAQQSAREALYNRVLRGLYQSSAAVLKRHLSAEPEVTAASQLRAVQLIYEQTRLIELEERLIALEELLLHPKDKDGNSS